MNILKHQQRLNNKAPLSREELNTLIVKAQGGSLKARNEVITRNIGLIFKIINSYGPPTNQDDYFQEGCLGILRAIKSFDTTRGIAFSTYAMYWIKQNIQRYILNTKGVVRTPVWRQELKNQYKRKTENMTEIDDDYYIRQIAASNNMSPESVKAGLKFEPSFTNAEQRNENGELVHELEDLVAIDNLKNHIDFGFIAKMLELLPARQRLILELYYLEGLTLQLIGDELSICRERVRQELQLGLFMIKAMMNQNELA